jgi:hypothetical protein
MKTLLSVITASAFAALSASAFSQTNQPSPSGQVSSEQKAPGTGGTSKAGTPGAQGSKSGPTASTTVGEGAAAKTPGGVANPTLGPSQTHQQDQSGVPGLPGSKAGPAVKEPSK